MTTSEYEQQATDFLTKTGTEFAVKFLRHAPHFDGDDESRDIYEVTLTKWSRSYTFSFGQSIANSGHHIKNSNGHELKFGWNQSERNTKKFRRDALFHFQSLQGLKVVEPIAPTAYDVLAALTKYDPESFKDFCDSYGYDVDSRKAEKTYNALKDEWNNLARLYTDEDMEALREIQ